jgi:transposase
MKSKLNPEMIEKLCKAVFEGNYMQTACRLAGISEPAFYQWIKNGEKDIQEGTNSIFTDLVKAIKKAESEAEAKMIQVVISNAVESKNWVSAMTYLERRYPERWGRKDRLQVDETKTQEIKVIIKHYQEEIQPGQPVDRVIEGSARELLPEGENGENDDKINDKG